eukprot:861798-Amphidinium_carterae.1
MSIRQSPGNKGFCTANPAMDILGACLTSLTTKSSKGKTSNTANCCRHISVIHGDTVPRLAIPWPREPSCLSTS